MKEGQCSRRKGPGKGQSPVATRAPLSSPGREGRRLRLASSSSFGPMARHSWPFSRIAGAVLIRTTGTAAHSSGGAGSPLRSLYDPRGHQRACTGKRPVSRGDANK